MKINCIYHRDQLITNFCQDKHCLMPLCPQCISQHTQYHEDQRTRPKYSTIHQTFAQVHTQITNCIQSLIQDKQRNGALLINIQSFTDIIKQKVQMAKDMVYRTLEQSFILLEKDINKQLQKIHEDKDIYILAKSQKQDNLLLQHIQQLQSMKSTLKGQRGLSNIIYFMREKVAQIDTFHTQFTTYLHTNENYSPKLEINTQSLFSLDAMIARIIKVGHTSTNKKKGQLTAQKSKTPIKSTYNINVNNHQAAQGLKQRHNVGFVQSEVKTYSPHLSRIKQSKQKSAVRFDGEYEKLSKKVAIMREQNDRLSRALKRTQNKFQNKLN